MIGNVRRGSILEDLVLVVVVADIVLVEKVHLVVMVKLISC